MQTLYVIHVSVSGLLSVDVFSRKHRCVSWWSTYFPRGQGTRARLRSLARKYPSNVHIMKGWSVHRMAAWKDAVKAERPSGTGQLSLDYLATSEPAEKKIASL